jgi:broad specificity phosphatase PhoE
MLENPREEVGRMGCDDASGTRILLARHAETSAPDRFHGAESDIGLSEWGHTQAARLGGWVADARPAAVYCSAMRRAVDTAAPVGHACGLEPTVIPALHERRIGYLSGVSREEGWATYAEVKERWLAGELEVSHPGGESFADIRRRVVPILEDLAERHRGETIAVIVHGVVIRVLLTSLVGGFSPSDFDRIAIDFASVNDLWYDGRTWTARALNQVVAPSQERPVA